MLFAILKVKKRTKTWDEIYAKDREQSLALYFV